jgi:hypothetical protein
MYQIQERSFDVLNGFYSTMFAPFLYRLLGARISGGTEISTLPKYVTICDMLTLGEQCFIGSCAMLGDDEIDQGWMTMKRLEVSRRSFVGNRAYIPSGTVIPENVLIALNTSAPANELMKNSDTSLNPMWSWFVWKSETIISWYEYYALVALSLLIYLELKWKRCLFGYRQISQSLIV